MSKSRRELEFEYNVEDWDKFFSNPQLTLTAQAREKGYALSTVDSYFSQSPGYLAFKSTKGRTRVTSFGAIISHIKNCTPLFSEQEFTGRKKTEDGKTKLQCYPFKCNKCGNVYLSTISSSLDVDMCPCCSGTGTPRWTFTDEVNDYLLRNNLKVVDCYNNLYEVKCMMCGATKTLRTIEEAKCNFCTQEESLFEKECKSRGFKIVSPFRFDGYVILECIHCGKKFSTKQEIPLKMCPNCKPKISVSARERDITALLKVCNVNVISQYEMVDPSSNKKYTIDVYCPELKVGFEFNGYAFHHSGPLECSVPRDYHALKTKIALSLGIRLYHIWESTTYGLCQSLVLSKVGKASKIYARSLSMRELSSTESKDFFNKCHVDGHVRCDVALGLCTANGSILAALSLNQRRIQSSGKVQWEIARFASAWQINVVGGYSKLLKQAIKFLKAQGANELVSYCNKDLSPDYNNTVYSKLGFTFVMESGPVYKYWSSKSVIYRGRTFRRGDLLARQVLQKQKLLEHYQNAKIPLPNPCTEYTLATGLGFQPCYNSGNFKYIMHL